MSDYKVSIIMPVYNAEKFLRDTLDSIVNQSIGVENLEVVIVNDASTDSSGDIIDEYCAKYPNFKAIHLKENVGGPHIPRNIAFRHTTADYIMFLDADDTYTPTACEALYDEISSGDADAVVGRYWRVYDDCRLISYSPYDPKVNDIKVYPKFSRGLGFVWTRILYPILYGRPLEYSDRVVINDVHENPEILKMLPAIWTKIIRREKFAPFKEFTAGEDLNFVLDVFFNSKIVLLNSEVIVNYSMRFDGNLSITKNVKFQLVIDTIRSYRTAIEKCNSEGFDDVSTMINPFFVNYINLLRQGDFDKSEKEMLYREISAIDKIYKKKGIMGWSLVNLIKILSM